MYSLFQILQRVLGLDFNLLDEQGLSPVHLGDDPVDHDTGACDLALLESVQGSLDSMRAVKCTRQGWVEIDDGHGERLAGRRLGKLGRGDVGMCRVGGNGLCLGGQTAGCGGRECGCGRGGLLAVEDIKEAV